MGENQHSQKSDTILVANKNIQTKIDNIYSHNIFEAYEHLINIGNGSSRIETGLGLNRARIAFTCVTRQCLPAHILDQS